MPVKQRNPKTNTVEKISNVNASGNLSTQTDDNGVSKTTNSNIEIVNKIIPDRYIISGIKGDVPFSQADPSLPSQTATSADRPNTTGYAMPIQGITPFSLVPIPPPIIILPGVRASIKPLPPSPTPPVPVPIPEPSSVILGLIGLSGILGFRKKTL